MNEINSLKEEN